MKARQVVSLVLASLAASCGDAELRAESDAGADDAGVALDLPWPAARLPPAPFPDDNVPTAEKRALGRLLFYDPILSEDKATACVTCHSEIWGLGDQLPRSVGILGKGAIGPGRVGPHMTRRNSPSLWNAAYKERLFWDGHAASLEEQALMPLENPDELAKDVDEAVAELRAAPNYAPLFRAAFPGEAEPITRDNLARALATFVRAYVSDRAPYDQYLRGDLLALDDAALRGMEVFAELDCVSCHVPPRFESERYAPRHVPELDGIVDEGRSEVTASPADRGAYRVPTLRNARQTGPYFHNGTVAKFEDAVKHEVDEQVALGKPRPSPQQLADLIAFLRGSLSDTSREQHPPDSVPSGLTIPLDGDRILRGGHEE